ncbi:HEAT repeat domain-containing protein [Chitinimonas lacunae]|uniref:HEAT repeat domain-containing protein n=1 Tax=Chitinimonas lacunae TaxID=1963018 RepID=A0ABV8MXH9_9NEIS
MSSEIEHRPYVLPAVIEPLVRRHAGDAAFYWAQHDSSAHSCRLDLARLLHFDRLLQAHLDGLEVAGATGWQLAFEELARWRGPGEVFVCAYLALAAGDGERLREVWLQLQLDPERGLRGLISALAWVGTEQALPWVSHWLEASQNSALQVAALRTAALGGATLLKTAQVAFEPQCQNEDARVRAAAARLGARLPRRLAQPVLLKLLEDVDPVVRAEAAIALGGQEAAAPPVLWQVCAEWIGRCAELDGWDRFQAERRLARWLRHLGGQLPPGHVALPRLLEQLPPRLGLLLALHHADPAHLPWVAAQMTAPETSRLAGWVWSALSGVQLEPAGLTLPPRLPDEETEQPVSLAVEDQDAGLPEPDPAAVQAWMAMHQASLPTWAPGLLGRALTPDILQQMLTGAPQALRWIAARRLGRPFFNNRAPALRQFALLHKLSASAGASS